MTNSFTTKMAFRSELRRTRFFGTSLGRLASILILCTCCFGGAQDGDGTCSAIAGEIQTSGMYIELVASLRPGRDGTYLVKPGGCSKSLLVVLPDEIPNYAGSAKLVRDDVFHRFLDARSDFREDAPSFGATFSGVLECAPEGKGFGTYRNEPCRLVLSSVGHGPERRIVVIQDPPMTMTGNRWLWRWRRFWRHFSR